MTNPTASSKRKTLTFGLVHPVRPFLTATEYESLGGRNCPLLIEAGGTMTVTAMPHAFFQPKEVRLLVPDSFKPNPLEVLDVCFADPEAPGDDVYSTRAVNKSGDIVSLDVMRGHVVHVVEVVLIRVHNPSSHAVPFRPVLVASAVGVDGANFYGMEPAMPPPPHEPIRLAPSESLVVIETMPFRCRPRILQIVTDSNFDVIVDEIKIGNRSQFTGLSSVPVELFRDGYDLGANTASAEARQNFALNFTNTDKTNNRFIHKIALEVEVFERLDHIPPVTGVSLRGPSQPATS